MTVHRKSRSADKCCYFTLQNETLSLPYRKIKAKGTIFHIKQQQRQQTDRQTYS